jgi:hypothetical protein
MVHLSIKVSAGALGTRTLQLEGDRSDVVLAVKQAILDAGAGARGWTAATLRLIYLGRDMPAEKTLGSFGMEDGGTYSLHALGPSRAASLPAEASLPPPRSRSGSLEDAGGSFKLTPPPPSRAASLFPEPTVPSAALLAAELTSVAAPPPPLSAASAAAAHAVAAASAAAEHEAALVRALRQQLSVVTQERDAARADASALRERLAEAAAKLGAIAAAAAQGQGELLLLSGARQ